MKTTEYDCNRGKELVVTGRPAESPDMCIRAEKEGCNPVNVYLNRGTAYLSIGETDWAIKDFSRVLEIDEDNEKAFYYRGVAHLGKGQYEEAVRDLTRAIELNHERGVAFLARGVAHAELDHIDASLRDFQAAVASSDREVENFADLYGGNRTRFDKSMALLEEERGPWSPVMNEKEVNRLKRWIAPDRRVRPGGCGKGKLGISRFKTVRI